ncbi:hypothetical protein HYPSUDRAFT_92468 [Hypholoma sublateritium FD-334 SS-4]|uniref:F-box domain-containing protein n=1 Tax=Hypholoma sublateritium (strain FD-334 SS-4) TaxID=945553 RepID=A0A0D2NCG5_HYPSF|nr:hypothetical protein HYPSUDRAFT_92468 [Hypholoma sublateritium FD-334 SS-4]
MSQSALRVTLGINGTPGVDLTVDERRHHNASNPISLLTYDILVDILMLNTVIDLDNPHIPSKSTRYASQVQHAWREIVVGCPMLWAASLDLADPPQWLKQVISRAGSAPFGDVVLPSLTPHFMSEEYTRSAIRRDLARNGAKSISISELLHLLASAKVDDVEIAFVTPFLHRCRRFFAKFKKDRWDQITEGISKPAPLLHTLSFVVQGSWQQVDQDFTLPQNIFDGCAPQLRVLDLRGCGCFFEAPIFYNLTTLIIRKPSSSHLPTAQVWLKILANMSNLNTLELSGAFSPYERDTNPIQDATLPHLTSLALTGNIEPCSILFKHLDFPFTPACTIDVRSYRTCLDDFFHSMVSHLQERLRLLDGDVLHHGLTLTCAPTGLGFMCRRLEDQRPDDTIISFGWFSSYAGPNIMALFPAFLSILKAACSEVRQLRVDVIHSAALSEERIVELLRPFRRVTTLYMAMSGTVERLLPAMNLRDVGADWVPFPVLETIVLEHAFNLGERGHAAEVDGLMEFIRARSRTQYVIKTVRFSHCGHVFTTIRALEALGINTIYSEE